jgi:hypothetical protein
MEASDSTFEEAVAVAGALGEPVLALDAQLATPSCSLGAETWNGPT